MKLSVLVAALNRELVIAHQIAHASTIDQTEAINEIRRFQRRPDFKGFVVRRFDVEMPFALAVPGLFERWRQQQREGRPRGLLKRWRSGLGRIVVRLGQWLGGLPPAEITPGIPDVEIVAAKASTAGGGSGRLRLSFLRGAGGQSVLVGAEELPNQ